MNSTLPSRPIPGRFPQGVHSMLVLDQVPWLEMCQSCVILLPGPGVLTLDLCHHVCG